MTLLLAGGQADPNLAVLFEAAGNAGLDVIDLRIGRGDSPPFCWSLDEGSVRAGGKRLQPAGAFIRHDVFGAMEDPRPAVATRALGWYQTVAGWLLSDPSIRMFNRAMQQTASNKPAALMSARQSGLRVPSTLITNETAILSAAPTESRIAKPVLGGDYCHSLSEALASADIRNGAGAIPAIVQQRLVAPEVRIYVIGQHAFAFEVRSSSLDYRVTQDAELILLPEVPQEVDSLRRLMAALGLDFGAADFKTDPNDRALVFLELNTCPMFARFDYVAGGQISAAIIRELTGTAGR